MLAILVRCRVYLLLATSSIFHCAFPFPPALTLSVTPSVKSTGSLTAHLIPSLNLGIQALDNIASATVFLDLDASATMQLSLDAVDSASVSVDNGESSSNSTTYTSNSTSTASSTSSAVSAYYSMSSGSNSSALSSIDSSNANIYYYNFFRRSASAAPTTTKPTSIPQAISSAKLAASSASASASKTTSSSVSNSTSSAGNSMSASTGNSSSSSTTTTTSSTGLQFGGCVEIDTGLAVNAGADAKFFDLFDASTQVPLFSKEFVLFKVNTELMFIIFQNKFMSLCCCLSRNALGMETLQVLAREDGGLPPHPSHLFLTS